MKMSSGFLRRHISSSLCSSLGYVRRELLILLKHRRGVRKSRGFFGEQHLRLHIGCGRKLKEGWVNIDLSSNADITLDLREPLPLPESCCSFIYSEHFLEHLDYPEPAISFLRECYRILESGGSFSAGVPDTEWPLMEYAKQMNEGYFQFVKERWHPAWCHTPMEHINYHFRAGDQHRFAYDFETLAQALTSVGFRDVERREFDPELDSSERKMGSLYVRAVKLQAK